MAHVHAHRVHPPSRRIEDIVAVRLIVGMEIHVELATRSKMFSRAPNPASASQAHTNFAPPDPNTLIDPVVLGLPGALPVINNAAVELSILVGLALSCRIAPFSKWDRKSYFYPDLPKNYQISQYDLPLCFDGSIELPPITPDSRIDLDALALSPTPGSGQRIGIIRAHLEEDAGKLLHDAPGGTSLDYSIADYNRAGTPLLEIVTAPDFDSAAQAVVFAQILRDICRFVGASLGVMQRGHIRFEPNINCELTLADGSLVRTPIVEVKNLNSFKALHDAIEFERRTQPHRWVETGKVMGKGAKQTRGWDDSRNETFLQREKEDADDYRYFPDPDLVPVVISSQQQERIAASLPELPLPRLHRYIHQLGLSPKEAQLLIDERSVCDFFECILAQTIKLGIDLPKAPKLCANLLLQSGQKRANERTNTRISAAAQLGVSGALVPPVLVSDLGLTPDQAAAIITMREAGELSAQAADELFGLLCSKEDVPGPSLGRGGSYPHAIDARTVAIERSMLTICDSAAIDAWCHQAIRDNPQSADDVKAGKVQAVGRLVGAAMKASSGKGDAAAIKTRLLELLGSK